MRILHYRSNAVHPAIGNDGVGRALDATLIGLSHNGHKAETYLYNNFANTDTFCLENTYCHKVVTQIDAKNILKDYDIVVFHGGNDLFIQDKRYIRLLHWLIVDPKVIVDMQFGNNTVIGVSKSALQYNNIFNKGFNDYVYSTAYLSVAHKMVIKDGIKNKGDYYIWVGGTDWFNQKGLDIAIRIAKIAQINLLIFGSGKNKDIIRYIENQSDDKIRYMGATTNDQDKYTFLSRAKGLLCPSIIPDGCPMTVVEALMCGCPVLAYSHSSFPELVEEGWGQLFASLDQQSLLRFIVHNKRSGRFDYESIMTGAQQRFDYKKLAQKHYQIYEKILGC